MHITDPTEKRWWQQKLESDPQQAELQRRGEEAHPRPPDRGRRPGALPAHQVRRPEALLARRRRELHRLDGRADPARRRQGRAGDRDRHGPPRPPERAGQHAGQDARRTCSPSSTTPRRKTCPSGDVKYHQGFSSRRDHARRPGAPEPGVQPLAPGDRQPGGRRLGARPAWTAAATREGTQVLPVLVHGDAAFAGQGVVMETLALAADARLLHRRHGAHRHQQPDRLHHQRPARQRARRCTAPTSSR